MSANVRESAIQFLQLAASGKVDEAFALVAPSFRHHNPYFRGDATALKQGMLENARKHPDKLFEVQRAMAEGPLVAIHSRVQMPSRSLTVAVVHIFRFENGKIAELWDVGQPQPDPMTNELGMF